MALNLKDEMGKAVNVLHRNLVRASGGKIAGDVMGMPVVELTTTGRTSGQKRTTMLTTPLQEGDTVVLVASWGGDDRHPQWYRNLQANPDVEIRIKGGEVQRMTAHTASDEEKAVLWPKITTRYKGYADYQTKTERPIPVVVLEPATGA
jgi:deazaflavin-dependent oxidoreductase (nitroreductase family)